MGNETLEKCCGTYAGGYELLLLYRHSINQGYSYCSWLAWAWVPPMSTNMRVLCYLLNCRRDTLETSSALPLEGQQAHSSP